MKNLIFIVFISIHCSLFPTHSFSQSCPPPDIVFNTQAQVDSFPINYPNCTVLDGDVSIGFMGATDITNLDSLIGLTSITGSFSIGHYGIDLIPGGLNCWGNPFLINIIGLSNLTNIGGDFHIFCNASLQNLSGLESLTSIGGSLRIGYAQDDMTGVQLAGNSSLTDIAALQGISAIGGDLEIQGNVSLTSLAGLENIDANSIENITICFNNSLSTCEGQSICDYLSDPGGIVVIYNNAPGCNNPGEIAITCEFQLPCLPYGNYYITSQYDVDSFQANYPGCFDLQGDVIIWENDNSDITNLSGLSGINSIEGDLRIIGNESLTNLLGMNGLQTIGGQLTIGDPWVDVNPSLINLTGLEGLNTISDIEIHGNDALISLQGIENIYAETIQNISIAVNPSLAICEVQSICDYLVSPNGNVNIGGNAPGCNSENQVMVLCDNSGCLAEGIIFTSQAQIDSFQINYPDCRIILGHVKIQGDDIENLNGLNGLTSCWEDLLIQNNPSLTSLSGLDSLIFIGGRLFISNNDFLTDLSGFNNLISVDGNLVIGNNDALTSLIGLENLTSLGGYFLINSNYALASLSGLNNLISVDGHLDIKYNDAMTSLEGLNNSISINGNLVIGYNDALTSLTGLENLSSLFGSLLIYENNAMTSLTGLNNVASIEENLKIEDNDALVSLAGLESLNVIGDFLLINNNSELISLTGIENINANSIKNLGIINNESLSACHVQSICNYLAAPGGTFGIGNNAPGCNSQEEVEKACDTLSVWEFCINDKFIIYPNPFSNTITIEFELIQPEIITLSIYNYLGEKVEVIAERKSVGLKKIEWNAVGLPAGIYFCVLKTNKGIQTKKLIKME